MNQPTEKRTTFLIWDSYGVPPKGKWIPVLWRSYGDGNNQIYSMPRLLEEQADALRERYLAWIYDLGESHVEGKRLIDHLELRPDFSYWWMTLIAEKCNSNKSLYIINVLKLLMLEELVISHSVSKIIYASGNKVLVKTFRRWCQRIGLVFNWQSLQYLKEPVSVIKRLYQALPYPMQAFIWFVRYICQRWPLKQQNGYQNRVDSNEITFVDYLFHLDRKALLTGQFASNYWTELVGILDRAGTRINWLHHYIKREVADSISQALSLLKRFNQNNMAQQFHSYLDGVINFPLLLTALRDYVRISIMSLKLIKIKRNFCPTGSKIDFWPLFKQDWLNSMRGPTAIWNCLCLNLFERTIGRLPHQKLGVYLQENQGWEMAFIHAWRAAGHGRLVGVPHTTVRYWDLRYFYDTRNYMRSNRNDLPLPDQLALNGSVAVNAYRDVENLKNRIVEVEALRYLYLADLLPLRNSLDESLAGPLRVLVFGDYMPAITYRQMKWLNDAAPLLPLDTRFTVKPHPACPIDPSEYPSLQLYMTDASLLELLADCDVAYTSNSTSAAVDAYCVGLPVVSMLDGETFNLSPLRGLAGVAYVTNPSELADALRSARNCERIVAKPYFCLDKELPRWRKLLDLNVP